MTTGLFHTPDVERRTNRARRKPKPKVKSTKRQAQGAATRDAFAELLSEGLSITEACERLGVRRQYGTRMLAKICADLGDQAQ